MTLFDNWQNEQYNVEQRYSQEVEKAAKPSKGKSFLFAVVGVLLISIVMGIILIAFIPNQLYQASVNINYLLSLFPIFQYSTYTSNANFNTNDPNYLSYLDQLAIRGLLITNIVAICLYALVALVATAIIFKNGVNVALAALVTIFGLFAVSITVALLVLSPHFITLPILFIVAVCLAVIFVWTLSKVEK